MSRYFGYFKQIEGKRREFRKLFLSDFDTYKEHEFILHSSLYFLYVINIIAKNRDINLEFLNLHELLELYGKAKDLIRQAVIEEIERTKKELNLRVFFKGNKAKKALETLFDKEQLIYDYT